MPVHTLGTLNPAAERTRVTLLPANRTPYEEQLSLSTDIYAKLIDEVGKLRGFRFKPNANVAEWLIDDYEFGDIRVYFDDPIEALNEGVLWLDERGEDPAVLRSLGWIGYDVTPEYGLYYRRNWNRFQLDLGQVRVNEEPHLGYIEHLAEVSTKIRDKFVRGYHGYDVRALELGRGAWGNSMWSADSGVRIREGGAIWSFGREHSAEFAPTEEELTAVGAWVPDEGDIGWLDIPWDTPGLTWDGFSGDASAARAYLLGSKRAYVGLYDADGELIGYRRARSVIADDEVTFEALTDFREGQGQTAASWSLVFDLEPLDVGRPGKLWGGHTVFEEPDESQILGSFPVSIALGRTVRERFAATISVASAP